MRRGTTGASSLTSLRGTRPPRRPPRAEEVAFDRRDGVALDEAVADAAGRLVTRNSHRPVLSRLVALRGVPDDTPAPSSLAILARLRRTSPPPTLRLMRMTHAAY